MDANIKKFTVQNLEKKEKDRFFKTEEFYLYMEWDASSQGTTLKEGDYFEMTMPETMKFPDRPAAREFDLVADFDDNGDGIVDRKGVVTGRGYVRPLDGDVVKPGEGHVGGIVKLVLNKEVENRYNVGGNMWITTKFNTTIVKENEPVTFTVKVNGKVDREADYKVTPTGHGELNNEVLNKWSYATGPNQTRAGWVARINHRASDLGDIELTDQLTPVKGETYIKDSFVLYEVKYTDPKGLKWDLLEKRTAEQLIDEGLLEFPDNNRFKLTLKNSGKKQYRLEYQTTYNAPGETLKNSLTLTSSKDEGKIVNGSHTVAVSGGTASGDLASKIKLIKVDADNEATLLKDAVFTVTKPDGKTFELTTNDQGEAISDLLEQGDYKVKEKTAPAGYELNDQEFTLTVSPAGGAIQKVTDKRITIDIPVVKTWVDSENADGNRPDEVVVKLVADDPDIPAQTLTLKKSEGWKGVFTGLRKFSSTGEEINYTVEEDPVPVGYTTSAPSYDPQTRTFTVTNTLETVNISVKKEWVGPATDSVTVKLLADNQPEGKTLTLNKDNNWQGTFKDLPTHKNKKKVEYSLEEVAVPGYKSEITGSVADGFTIKNTNIETTTIFGVKTWNDDNDRDRKRPKEITVKLLGDGKLVKEEKVEVGPDGEWTYTFRDLPKYDPTTGTEISYTIAEDQVEGYEIPDINGFNITNTRNPDTVAVPVKKVWVGPKGTQATVQLFDTDGEVAGKTLTLNEGNGWQGVFNPLPKYKDGHEIKYTVKEVDVDTSKYEVTVSDFVPCALPRGDQQVRADAECGFTITNRNIEKVDISGVKTWNDDGDRDGKRPGEITVRLKANGGEQASQKVTAANNWAYSFTDLPKYDNDGNPIGYSVTEDAVGEYATKIDADGTITNSYTPGKTSVSVSKVWDDADNQDGVRPDSVKVQLKADGAAVGEPVVLNADNKWTHTWTDLFINNNKDKKKIDYTVEEVDVPQGYEAKVEGDAQKGYTVTNTHVPEQVSIPVVKKWEGKTGASATFHLYAGKADTGKVLTLDATVDWKGSFDGLPKFKDGKEIAYTITEDALEGYEAKVKGDMRDGFTVTNTYVDKKLAKTGFSGSGLLLGSTVLGGAGAVMLAVRRKREHA